MNAVILAQTFCRNWLVFIRLVQLEVSRIRERNSFHEGHNVFRNGDQSGQL